MIRGWFFLEGFFKVFITNQIYIFLFIWRLSIVTSAERSTTRNRRYCNTWRRSITQCMKKTADYECEQYNKKFTQSRSLIQHLKTLHGCQTYAKCKHCTQIHGDTSSCARLEKDAHGTHTEVPEKIESKIEQQKAKYSIENFFQSFRIQADNKIDVFNFVTEHLEDLKLFVRNKIAELAPLKFSSLLLYRCWNQPMIRKSAVIQSQNRKFYQQNYQMIKTLKWLTKWTFQSRYFQQVEVDLLFRKLVIWISILSNSNLSEEAATLLRHPL